MSSHSAIVIVGSGGHALVVAEASQSAGFVTLGFYDPNSQDVSKDDLPIYRSPNELGSVTAFALGVGANYQREEALKDLKKKVPHATFPTIIHSSAYVSPTAGLAEGCVILAQASIGPHSRLGGGALLNTGSSLDHESVMGDFSSLGPGARTGGKVLLGDRSFVGMNSSILHGRTVGSDSVIGAHSLVREDVPANVVAYGVPCRVIRSRDSDEPYL